MKCSACGSEWEWSASFDEEEARVCPFCHASLKKDDMSAKEALYRIVRSRGVQILCEQGAVNLMMGDLTGGQKDVRHLQTAMAVGTGAETYRLLKERGCFDETAKEALEKFLGECGFTQQFGQEVSAMFSYALKGLDPDRLSRSRKKRETKNERLETYYEQINADGSVTKGTKVDGVWNGPFKKEYDAGAYYEGTYVNGKISGRLVYVDGNGSAFIGWWENGNWNGPCRKEEPDGSVIEGTLIENIWHGPFKRTERGGRVTEGLYEHGVLKEESVKLISENL